MDWYEVEKKYWYERGKEDWNSGQEYDYPFSDDSPYDEDMNHQYQMGWLTARYKNENKEK